MAPLPARQPGVREPGADAGAQPARRRARLTSVALAVLAGALAVRLAAAEGVVGVAAVPPLLRVGVATVGLFAVCGFGLTRLLLPAGLRAHEPLWVLPVGACASALALTVLGYAHVPFEASPAIVLAAGALTAVAARRRRTAAPPGAWRRSAWPVWLALLLAAVALVPLFRAGFATVEGMGQDAHLAVGTAQLLQNHPPTAIAIEEPVDRVPLVWRSKPPIYYVLAASATLAAVEPYQAISTVAAVLLGLACLGFFLLARELLGAPRWAALAGMALVGLDRMVLHTVMHPYFNQTWGFMTLPFALVLSWWAVRERTRGGAVLLALVVAVGAFAYPLLLPIPLVALAVWLWPERRRLSPRRLYRGRRSLLWMVPVAVALGVPLAGVLEKVISGANVVVDVGHPLRTWGGDVFGWFDEAWFFGLPDVWWLLALSPLMLWAVWRALRGRDPQLGRGLIAVLALAALLTVEFRLRDFGWYFHFKILAFVAPLVLVLVASGLARARRRRLGRVAVGVLLLFGIAAARDELAVTFDQLPRQVLALRSLTQDVPPGDSIRLDVDPQQQNWIAYMLHQRPLCSLTPLLGTSYPHVAMSRRADFIVAAHDAPRPADAAAGPPVRRLEAFTLYRARPSLPGPEICTQQMVQTVTVVDLG